MLREVPLGLMPSLADFHNLPGPTLAFKIFSSLTAQQREVAFVYLQCSVGASYWRLPM